MGTKFGVSIEELQKLREFQFLLMKRNMKSVNKMEFLANVQIKAELVLLPQIVKISIVDKNIHVDDSSIIIYKSRIYKLIEENTYVTVKFKMPLPFIGSFITLYFRDGQQKQDFLNSVGEVEDYESDESRGSDQTPLSSDESESLD